MFKHVIYHKACPDGFGSAYIAWKVLGNNSAYIPVSYYDPTPEIVNSKILTCKVNAYSEAKSPCLSAVASPVKLKAQIFMYPIKARIASAIMPLR